MANLPYTTQELLWLGDSLEEIFSFPKATKKQIGFALRQVQNGLTPEIAKPLTEFGSGVYELRQRNDGNTYRVVYLIKLKSGVYVLDAFMKKSTSGKSIPKGIKTRIQARIAEAKQKDSR
jgi:phage-related protein